MVKTALLQHLVGQGANDRVGALQQIPRNMRSLFLHALQSFLWNKAASHRVETLGVQEVQVGDLVLPLAADVPIAGELFDASYWIQSLEMDTVQDGKGELEQHLMGRQ